MQATRFAAANYVRARKGKDGRRVGDVKGHDRETNGEGGSGKRTRKREKALSRPGIEFAEDLHFVL